MKIITTLFLTILSTQLLAETLTVDDEKALMFFSKSIPLVKNQPIEIKDAKSVQQEYFELTESTLFNKAMIPFYTKNIENSDNFIGFNSSK